MEYEISQPDCVLLSFKNIIMSQRGCTLVTLMSECGLFLYCDIFQ